QSVMVMLYGQVVGTNNPCTGLIRAGFRIVLIGLTHFDTVHHAPEGKARREQQRKSLHSCPEWITTQRRAMPRSFRNQVVMGSAAVCWKTSKPAGKKAALETGSPRCQI